MTWEIDSTHSHVSFAIRVMSVSTTRGRFNAFRGRLHIDEQNPANSWVDAQVEAASIDTHNKLRDAHLRSAAFFDVKNYSTITFTSTHVEHVGGQNYQVTGNLTLHGVTRSITFDVVYHGHRSLMDTRTDLTAKATINRHDFGVGQGAAVRVAASPMVTIEIGLEAVQQSVEVQEVVATFQQEEEMTGRIEVYVGFQSRESDHPLGRRSGLLSVTDGGAHLGLHAGRRQCCESNSRVITSRRSAVLPWMDDCFCKCVPLPMMP